jgi:membrane protease YdiL (CAAX protease family)
LLEFITAEYIVCLAGLILLGVWLVRTSWGRKALADSVPRRNNIPLYLALIPLLVWFSTISLVISAKEKFLHNLPDWQGAFLDNAILCLCSLAVLSMIILMVRSHFAERLGGLGLHPKTMHKDFLAALVNLLSIWPIMLFVFVVTVFVGKFVSGPDFDVNRHEELKMLTAYSQMSLRILIIATTVVIVPVFEEVLFRGLLQSVVRSYVVLPWRSVLISSVVFTVVHPDIAHWPTLFVLSVCLGYSYEKSGSLFRPIFIHSVFNGISVASTLLAS